MMHRIFFSFLPLFLAFHLLCCQPDSILALDPGEIVGLKDMQAEWGTQLGWTGSPSCQWKGVTCNLFGNVIALYVFSGFRKTQKE